MSFQIKDKRKIQLLRKCVTILTQDSEELSMHFTKTDIRFFTQQEDCTTYMCDFSASWFSKFVAPDHVTRGEGERMQITCHRDTFLQSFNLIDDTELEFMVEVRDQDEGVLKVMKTRDMVIVESSMVFRIDPEVICDETYIFPADQLLIKGRIESLLQVKHIFRQNAKAEILALDFTPTQLSFKGQVNKKFGYEVQADKLDSYGVYLARQSTVAQNYQIKMPLKHILGVLKVAELVEGDFSCAMECIGDDSAVCFLFTKANNFQFNIGVASVYFENKDGDMIDSGAIAGVMTNPAGGRLRRQQGETQQIVEQVPVGADAASSTMQNMIGGPVQDASISRNNNNQVKQEQQQHSVANQMAESGNSMLNNQAGMRQRQASELQVKKSPASIKKSESARKRLLADEQMEDEETKQEGVDQEEEGDQEEQVQDAQADGEEVMNEEKAREKRLKKEKFYNEVDQEEFF